MVDAKATERGMPPSGRCPICRRAVTVADNPNRPFCSERCRLVDLGNWATEHYRVPSGPASEDTVPDGGDGDDDPS